MSPRPDRPAASNASRTSLVVVLVVFGFLAYAAAALIDLGGRAWMAASLIAILSNGLVIAYLLKTRDRLMARLYLLGLVYGFAELASDSWGVDQVQILTYATGGPFIWSSPLYMPFAWAVVILELSYVGIRLAEWKGMLVASLILAVGGAAFIPAYEALAHWAGFWWYSNCWLLFGIAPVFMLLNEGLLSLALPPVAQRAARAGVPGILLLGILLGVWVYVAALISFRLLGQPPG